jgi:zinc transporter ZupT
MLEQAPTYLLELVWSNVHLLELVLILVFLAATAWIAVRAFQNPKGTYLRSLIGFLLGALAAAAIWWLFPPISSEAGFGYFVLFCIVVALCGFVAVVACIAASARHVLDTFGNRRR